MTHTPISVSPETTVETVHRRKLQALSIFSNQFFGRRGKLDLTRDRAAHRRFAMLYEDLLA